MLVIFFIIKNIYRDKSEEFEDSLGIDIDYDEVHRRMHRSSIKDKELEKDKIWEIVNIDQITKDESIDGYKWIDSRNVIPEDYYKHPNKSSWIIKLDNKYDFSLLYPEELDKYRIGYGYEGDRNRAIEFFNDKDKKCYLLN